jgi:hypothetical protein
VHGRCSAAIAKKAIADVSGQFRLVLTPTIYQWRGNLLSTHIYAFDGNT